jgi:hypothetical protein
MLRVTDAASAAIGERFGLRYATPSAVGVDGDAVAAFLDDVDAAGLDLHGLMLHRRGRVCAQGFSWPYRADRPRVMHSVAKSFTACAVGMALEEGRFALTDTVVSFFPEFAPANAGENLAAMTVEDLLTMRTGHAEETSGAVWRGIRTSWIAEFFKIPVVHRPGTIYVYTSAASYMLSAILTKTTGLTLHDYLRPRLFAPLGVQGETWDVGPDGINPGGNGLTCTTIDLLKLGVLMAQGGVWEGRRLLSESWIRQATTAHAPGYGYHWVVGPHGEFSALGVFVQMVMVFPEHEATLTIIGAIDGSRRILPLVQQHFPAAFRDGAVPDPKAGRRLAARPFRHAGVEPLRSDAAPAKERLGTHHYRFEANPQGVTDLVVDLTASRCRVTVRDAAGEHSITCGVDSWLEGQTDMPGRDLHHGYRLSPARVVAGARWVTPDRLDMSWIFLESAFRDTVECRFDGDRIRLSRRVNVNSGGLTQPDLIGRRTGP